MLIEPRANPNGGTEEGSTAPLNMNVTFPLRNTPNGQTDGMVGTPPTFSQSVSDAPSATIESRTPGSPPPPPPLQADSVRTNATATSGTRADAVLFWII